LLERQLIFTSWVIGIAQQTADIYGQAVYLSLPRWTADIYEQADYHCPDRQLTFTYKLIIIAHTDN
jgi:hypothetical protein